MKAVPAIDLLDGKVVRLHKGDYGNPLVYRKEPADLFRDLYEKGFKQVHVVDLDAARTGIPSDLSAVFQWSDRISFQLGGGIRSVEQVSALFDGGIRRLVLGSVAADRPEEVCQWGEKYGRERFILAADSLDGKVAVSGWLRQTGWTTAAFIKAYASDGFERFLCTDISRDGTMTGPAVEWYRELVRLFPEQRIIASGGVRDESDFKALVAAGVHEVVVGKAWLEGHIDLSDMEKYTR